MTKNTSPHGENKTTKEIISQKQKDTKKRLDAELSRKKRPIFTSRPDEFAIEEFLKKYSRSERMQMAVKYGPNKNRNCPPA